MKQYKPKLGQQYWMINSRGGINQTKLSNSPKSQKRAKLGNTFKTQKDAEDFLQLMKDVKSGKLHLTKQPYIDPPKLEIIKTTPWWAFWRNSG